MLMRMIYDDNLAQAAYLVGCQQTGEAIVFDPERDVDRYIELAAAHGLKIVAAAETHIHADFLSGTRELAEQVGAKLYLSDEGDADWKYGWLNDKAGGGTYDHRLLKHGDRFTIGAITIEAVHTPGHTPEHMCFRIYDAGLDEPMGMITGDFVFVGDLGRPDLLETAAGYVGVKEASAKRLQESAAKFMNEPDFEQIWPAHGAGSACGKALGSVPQSTAGYEKRHSPALQLANQPEAFVSFILEGQPEPPLYFARMKVHNRDGVPRLPKLPEPPSIEVDQIGSIDGRAVKIIDTRLGKDFKAGHLPGSLRAPIGPMFHTVAGSYVEPSDDIVLVCPSGDVEQALRELVRIGLDNVVGHICPVSLAAFAAGGGKLATMAEMTVAELAERRSEVLVLDVRRATEHAEGAIPGAKHIAHTRLPKHLSELPRDRPIAVHCKSGGRSAAAVALLQREGFDAINLIGGFTAWQASDGEIAVPTDAATIG